MVAHLSLRHESVMQALNLLRIYTEEAGMPDNDSESLAVVGAEDR